MHRIDSDVFVVVVLPNTVVSGNAYFTMAGTVAPSVVSTEQPKGELLFSHTDDTTGQIQVEESGMALFYDIRFVLSGV